MRAAWLAILALAACSLAEAGFTAPSSSFDPVHWQLTENAAVWPNAAGAGMPSMVPAGGSPAAAHAVVGGLDCVQITEVASGANGGVSSQTPATTNNVTNPIGEFGKSISVRGKFFITSFGNGGFVSLVRKKQTMQGEATTANGDALQLNLNNTNNCQYYVLLSNTTSTFTLDFASTDRCPANTWTTIGFSWDGSTIRLYRDGVAHDTVAFAGPIQFYHSGQWYVAGHPTGGNLQGCARDVWVTNVVEPASWFN